MISLKILEFGTSSVGRYFLTILYISIHWKRNIIYSWIAIFFWENLLIKMHGNFCYCCCCLFDCTSYALFRSFRKKNPNILLLIEIPIQRLLITNWNSGCLKTQFKNLFHYTIMSRNFQLHVIGNSAFLFSISHQIHLLSISYKQKFWILK